MTPTPCAHGYADGYDCFFCAPLISPVTISFKHSQPTSPRQDDAISPFVTPSLAAHDGDKSAASVRDDGLDALLMQAKPYVHAQIWSEDRDAGLKARTLYELMEAATSRAGGEKLTLTISPETQKDLDAIDANILEAFFRAPFTRVP